MPSNKIIMYCNRRGSRGCWIAIHSIIRRLHDYSEYFPARLPAGALAPSPKTTCPVGTCTAVGDGVKKTKPQKR